MYFVNGYSSGQAMVEGTMESVAHRRPGRPNAHEAEQKRIAILEAGLEEFARVGFRGAAIRNIAAKAEISTRTLYNQYVDKLALFEACLEFASKDLRSVAAEEEGDLEARLTALMVAMHEQLSDDRSRQIALLIFREGAEFDELQRIARTQFERYQVDPVAQLLIGHGYDAGSASKLAVLFVGMALGEWQRRLIFGGPPVAQREVTGHIKMLTRLFLEGAVSFRDRARLGDRPPT